MRKVLIVFFMTNIIFCGFGKNDNNILFKIKYLDKKNEEVLTFYKNNEIVYLKKLGENIIFYRNIDKKNVSDDEINDIYKKLKPHIPSECLKLFNDEKLSLFDNNENKDIIFLGKESNKGETIITDPEFYWVQMSGCNLWTPMNLPDIYKYRKEIRMFFIKLTHTD